MSLLGKMLRARADYAEQFSAENKKRPVGILSWSLVILVFLAVLAFIFHGR